MTAAKQQNFCTSKTIPHAAVFASGGRLYFVRFRLGDLCPLAGLSDAKHWLTLIAP
jgi:hypothetical protein